MEDRLWKDLQKAGEPVVEAEKIKAKNPGVLEVPEDKKFWQMPLSHYIDLAKDKGKPTVARAINNLARWMKKKAPDVADRASKLMDQLKGNKEWQAIGATESFTPEQEVRYTTLAEQMIVVERLTKEPDGMLRSERAFVENFEREIATDAEREVVLERYLDIMDRVDEEEKNYADVQSLKAAQQAIITELTDTQKKLKEIETRLEKIKEHKKELEPDVLAILHKVRADGIRLKNALVYISKMPATPSFAQVLAEVRGDLAPKVVKMLEDTYEVMKIAGAREGVRVNLNKGGKADESVDEGILQKVKEMLANVFKPAASAVTGAIDKIEGLLGIGAKA